MKSISLIILLCLMNGFSKIESSANDLSLYNLFQLNQKVRVTSFFKEDKWNSFSSVSSINQAEWRKRGSTSTFSEVLDFVPGVSSYSNIIGSENLSIRGFTRNVDTNRGLATLIDGVPISIFSFGSAQYHFSKLSSEILEQVELIRGPGSALHGNDAFHGVLSFITLDNIHEDFQEFSSTIGSKNIFKHSIKGSFHKGDNTRFIYALSQDYQGDQHLVEKSSRFPSGKLSRKDSNRNSDILFKIVHNTNQTISKLTYIHHKIQNLDGPIFPPFQKSDH
ncbi:Plug domain-containing protein, partial [bacterium]|nr:Plug domain-containing protein [bacterium]